MGFCIIGMLILDAGMVRTDFTIGTAVGSITTTDFIPGITDITADITTVAGTAVIMGAEDIMAVEDITVGTQVDTAGTDKTFAEVVSEAVKLYGHRKIADEFECIPSTVLRWAAGIAKPREGMQKVVIATLERWNNENSIRSS
jgi:hypothetical protein